MLGLFGSLLLALSSASDTVRIDLLSPVSPRKVPGAFVAKVRSVPQGWLLETRFKYAAAPELPKGLPSLVKQAGAPDAKATSTAGVETLRQPMGDTVIQFDRPSLACKEFNPNGDLSQVHASAILTKKECTKLPLKLAPALAFLEVYESMEKVRDSIWSALPRVNSPSAIDKLVRTALAAPARNSDWGKLFQPGFEDLVRRIDLATTRTLDLSLEWNDTVVVKGTPSPGTPVDSIKPVEVVLIHQRKVPSMKGVSVGLGWYSHPVNNYTVIHSTDTTRKLTQSTIQNQREDFGGSIQPSLVIFLPFADLETSEFGFTLGLSPKIDLSNYRIFDASFSAGLAWASYPFGIQVSLGMTPLAHLKGNYECGKLYDGDLDAASVTQSTFHLMVGGGVFWKVF